MGAFKLGKMTFGSLFKKPSTVRYPFETKAQPIGLKGQIGIEVDQCILCGMCDRSCTTGAIVVSKEDRTWTIDRFRCVQCGYCVTVCPKSCLFMLPDYAAASSQRSRDIFSIPAEGENGEPQVQNVPYEPPKPDRVMRALYPSHKKAHEVEALDDIPDQCDHQIEDLLRLMDEQKANKARAALLDFTCDTE